MLRRIHGPDHGGLEPVDPAQLGLLGPAALPYPSVEVTPRDHRLPGPPQRRSSGAAPSAVMQLRDGRVQQLRIGQRQLRRPRLAYRRFAPAQPPGPTEDTGARQPERRDQPLERPAQTHLHSLKAGTMVVMTSFFFRAGVSQRQLLPDLEPLLDELQFLLQALVLLRQPLLFGVRWRRGPSRLARL